MLSLTGPAIRAIRTLISQPGMPDRSGLRIANQDTAGSLALSIRPGPEEGDQVIEAGGARVFLEDGAATMLRGKALDAQEDADGVVFQISLPDD